MLGKRRITPADAGKTRKHDPGAQIERDHPRGCGENRLMPQLGRIQSGSPPRMRGKRNISSLREDHNGITPADAGKTGVGNGGSSVSEDHPRGCGENRARELYQEQYAGSPPRMRGKLSRHYDFGLGARITPADAGKTWHGGVWH